MGLDIHTGKNDYHASYHGLHMVRLLACVVVGDVKPDIHYPNRDVFSWGELFTSARFPNLMLHSDCEGTYTMNGKWGDEQLLNGNLPELVKELRDLKRLHTKWKKSAPLEDIKTYAMERGEELMISLKKCAEEALKNKETMYFT